MLDPLTLGPIRSGISPRRPAREYCIPSPIGNYNIPAASGDIPDPSASGILSAGGDIPGPAPIGITADVGIFQAGRGYPRVSLGHDHRLAALKASKRRGLVSS